MMVMDPSQTNVQLIDDKCLQLLKQLSLITLSQELLLSLDVPSYVLHLLGFIVVHCQATHEMQDKARHTTFSPSSRKLKEKYNSFWLGHYHADAATWVFDKRF